MIAGEQLELPVNGNAQPDPQGYTGIHQMEIDAMHLLTVNEACERLRVSRGKFYGLVREGFPIKKIGTRTLIEVAAIDTFIQSLPGREDSEAGVGSIR